MILVVVSAGPVSVWLGWVGAKDGLLPPDLVVIQVGDLVDRGPDSSGVLDVVARMLAEQPLQWIQLVGNHEAQYLPGGALFWRDPLASADGDELLLTHAGLTLAGWQELGAPMSAAVAAAALNDRPELI
jgi:hypothetical protein